MIRQIAYFIILCLSAVLSGDQILSSENNDNNLFSSESHEVFLSRQETLGGQEDKIPTGHDLLPETFDLTGKPEVEQTLPAATDSPGQHMPLSRQNAAQLWASWNKLIKRKQLQQIPIVNALLAQQLRNRQEEKLYEDIYQTLLSAGLPVGYKGLLIDLLSETATPQALALLFKIAALGPESPLYAFALQAISRIGEIRWDGRFHEELSPLLESAWNDPDITDESMLTAIGKALAEVGAPEGVKTLLESLKGNVLAKAEPQNQAEEESEPEANVQTDDQTETNAAASTQMSVGEDDQEKERIKQIIAYENLPQNVHNPKATPVLGNCLANESSGTVSGVCGETLAGIGGEEAIVILENHIKGAPDEEAPNIKPILEKIQDPNEIEQIISVAQQDFASPMVHQEVKDFATDLAGAATMQQIDVP